MEVIWVSLDMSERLARQHKNQYKNSLTMTQENNSLCLLGHCLEKSDCTLPEYAGMSGSFGTCCFVVEGGSDAFCLYAQPEYSCRSLQTTVDALNHDQVLDTYIDDYGANEFVLAKYCDPCESCHNSQGCYIPEDCCCHKK